MASERAAWWCCWWQILRPDRRLRPPALSSLPYRPRVIRHVRPLTEGVGEWRSPLSNTPCRGSERHCSVSACFTPSKKVSQRAGPRPRAVWTRARNGRWAPSPERNGCAEHGSGPDLQEKNWKSAEDVYRYSLAEDVYILVLRVRRHYAAKGWLRAALAPPSPDIPLMAAIL